MTSSIQELVTHARSQIRNLTVDEFARELGSGPTRPAPSTARSSTPRRAPCSTAHRAVAQRWPSRASEPSATPTSRTWTAD